MPMRYVQQESRGSFSRHEDGYAVTSLAERVTSLSMSADLRKKKGTAAALRRGLTRMPESNATDATATAYARAYRSALSESLLLFVHLSKSGGTALCELAKLNGCSRAAAGQSTFAGNCANKQLFDGPWWMPPDVVRQLTPLGLRTFAERSFLVNHVRVYGGDSHMIQKTS